ncbi:MAG TPA: hypothetical protein VGI58_13555 [Streptosporangiaceae bacterium]|jgi:hypothetical protein
MVILIGGILIGFFTILLLSSVGWFSIILFLWAALMIGAGIREIRNGRPEPPSPADLQKALRDLAQSPDALPLQRLAEGLPKVSDPALLRHMAEVLRKDGSDANRRKIELIEQRLAEVNRQPKQAG